MSPTPGSSSWTILGQKKVRERIILRHLLSVRRCSVRRRCVITGRGTQRAGDEIPKTGAPTAAPTAPPNTSGFLHGPTATLIAIAIVRESIWRVGRRREPCGRAAPHSRSMIADTGCAGGREHQVRASVVHLRTNGVNR